MKPSGYVIVYGTNSNTYKFNVDVGNVTEAKIGNLERGKKYYFAGYAYAGNLTSVLTSEVSCEIPLVGSPKNLRIVDWK